MPRNQRPLQRGARNFSGVQVTGWIDLAELKSRMPPLPAEPLDPLMNGTAYDAAGRRLFVTGKLWPKVFEFGGGCSDSSLTGIVVALFRGD